jgi:transcriptional regulator with XRE-family HTH domain
METINSRLIYYINHLGLSKNSFARKINTSSAMISKITTKDINFGVDVLVKIVQKCPELNIYWLLTGNGEMILGESEIQNLCLDKKQKVGLYEQMQELDECIEKMQTIRAGIKKLTD